MADAPEAPAHAGFSPELRIDWLDAGELGDGRRGRLGLTFLPGKRGPSDRYPGHVFRRELDDDLGGLKRIGVRRLILLVEDSELVRWSDPAIVERGRDHGIDVRRHPIADGGAPASTAEMNEILDEIDEAREEADVAIACMGGVGRSGLVAACALVRAGLNASAAIARVRAVRHPMAVETPAQERFVAAFAATPPGA
jgi:protein-tyrosine phosphatase